MESYESQEVTRRVHFQDEDRSTDSEGESSNTLSTTSDGQINPTEFEAEKAA